MYGKCSEVRYINTKVRTKVFITYVPWYSTKIVLLLITIHFPYLLYLSLTRSVVEFLSLDSARRLHTAERHVSCRIAYF